MQEYHDLFKVVDELYKWDWKYFSNALIIGTIDIPPVEGRFQEILSTQKILDTETDIQYDGLVDREFLELVNEIFEEKEKYFEIVKMNINQFKENTCIN